MSSATASRPLNSLLLAALMITSSMAVVLTAMPWMADTVIADGTSNGSDASDNYSSPSQTTTFDVVLNGTLNSSDQEDWYYIEMFSGDTLDLEASCVIANCGTYFSTNNYNNSLTTNMSDTSFTHTNNGSTSYNLTFGFYNYALQSISVYLFEAKITSTNGTGGGNQTTEQVDIGVWNGTQVTGPLGSNLSAGNHSLAWEVFNLTTTGNYLLTSSIYIGSNSYSTNHSLNTSASYNTIPFTLSVIDSDCSIYMYGELYDVGGNNSQWLTSYNYYGYGPCVNTGGNGTNSPGISLTNWATNGTATDYDTNYTTSDVIWGSVWTNNTASGTNYSVTWLVYEYYTSTVVAMNLTNSSFNNYYSDSFQIASNMSVGYYALTANLFNHDSGTLIDVVSSYFAINNASGGGSGGNGTNGSGQNDMGTGGDVVWAQLTSFSNTHQGTVGGNDSSDSYYIVLYSGDELEFDANCYTASGNCSIDMQVNSSSIQFPSYYNLTSNYSDSVYFYNNTNSYDEYVYITFTGSSAIEEDYEFYAMVNNQNGTGGNGTQNWTDPSLNLNITEEYDWGNGNGANYTFELQIDDLYANHTYSFYIGVMNGTGDEVVFIEVQGSTGNTSTTLSSYNMHIDSGCYLAFGFAYDETTGYEVPYVVDFVALHSTCTTVFTDMKDDVVNSGDDLEAIFHLVDVNPGTTYTIEWQVKNDTTLIDYGNFTSYNSTSNFYDFEANINTTGWADDCYSLWAELAVNGTVITNAFQDTDSQFELGSGTCEEPSIWVDTDNSWYSNTSEVQVTIEAHDLDDTMIYTVDWYVYDSNWNMYNWSNYSISNTDWSENTFSFWYMPDDCYSVEVEIWDEQGNSLDYDATYFDVGQGCNTQGSQAWVELWNDGDHWDLGETIDLDYDLNDLTLNNSYYMEWQIYDMMDLTVVDNNSMQLSYTSVEYYSSTINASGLSEGCYWMQITLYDISGSTGAYMDSDNQEFGVGDIDCNPLYVNMQTYDILPASAANFSFEMGNMMNGSNYSLTFKLFNANNLLNETTWDFMAWSEYAYDYIDFGYLQNGCYMVQIYLFGEDGDYTNVGEWFKVGDVFCGSTHLEMLDRHKVYQNTTTTGETIMFDMRLNGGEINQSIEFYYDLYEYDGLQEMYGSFNITINSNEQNMSLGLGNLSDGCYGLAVSWSEPNGDYREEHADFAVGSNDGCWDASIWIHSPEGKDTFENDEDVSFTVVVEDRKPEESYSAFWQIDDSDGTTIVYGNFNATDMGPKHLENITVIAMDLNDDECFTIEVGLSNSMGDYIDYSRWMFSTGDGDCWPPQIETWFNEWDENGFELKAVNLDIGNDYYLEAQIFDDDNNLVFNVSESEFATNDVVNFYYNVSSLGDGCYYADSQLYDDEWNLLDETEGDVDGEVFSIGEVNCWLYPGMYFDWNGDGEIEFNIWDLKENDNYTLDIAVYSYEENGDLSWDSDATHYFTAIDGWQDINIAFDLYEDQQYWLNVLLSHNELGLVLNESGDIWVYQNSEYISLNIENDVIGSGDDLEFSVTVEYLDENTDYELLVKLLDHDDNEVDSWVEPSVTEGEHWLMLSGPNDGLDAGFYYIDAQLFDTNDAEYSISSDHRRVCVGDGCPSDEQAYGNSTMHLVLNWDDIPEVAGYLDCDEMRVMLVPEQRWIDDQNGDATYGAYPDWWHSEGGPPVGPTQNFSFDEIPSGAYAVIVVVSCEDIVEVVVDGNYQSESTYFQGTNHGTIGIHTFTNGTTTTVEIDLETSIDDGNEDDNIHDFMDQYSTGDYTYRVFLRDGDNGPELVVSMDMSLDATIIVDIDSEEGDGDGQISAEENNMLQYMLSMEVKEDHLEKFQWNGIELTAADLIISSYEIMGLVEGDDIIFRDFFVFSVNLGEDGGTFTYWEEESAGMDPCDMSDEGDMSLTYVAAATSPYEIISIEGTGSDFTENANGVSIMELGCGDSMPGELTITFGEEDDGGEGGEENNTTNITNTPPSCFIHWYRDGDNLADEGMALLTAGDSIDEITVTEGDSFTIYIYCWDDDGDEMTLSITPPFGSDASFTGTSVSEFIQLTVPTGFAGKFAFGAEWSDGATGGEFDFDIIIESAEDEGDDENEESDSTSSASFVPGFTGVFTIAAFLGAVLVMMRREQEE